MPPLAMRLARECVSLAACGGPASWVLTAPHAALPGEWAFVRPTASVTVISSGSGGADARFAVKLPLAFTETVSVDAFVRALRRLTVSGAMPATERAAPAIVS